MRNNSLSYLIIYKVNKLFRIIIYRFTLSNGSNYKLKLKSKLNKEKWI